MKFDVRLNLEVIIGLKKITYNKFFTQVEFTYHLFLDKIKKGGIKMPYAKLLKEMIASTNYTNIEITEKCKELGEPINETYLNKIVNGKLKAPSEKKSRAIAKVLNVDERKLIIEGYIDKAPKEIKEFLENIRMMGILGANKCTEKIDYNLLYELEKELAKEPLSDIIINISDNKQNYMDFMEKETYVERFMNEKFELGFHNPIGIEITDNAMSPKINKGDKVTFEFIGKNDYKSTDILLVQTKQNPEIRVRNAIKINNTIKLQGYSSEYIEPPCNKDDLIILGKVSHVIKKI